jgi:NTP pyrophosphatase (non-canonical NTP hydrolase)
VSDISYNLAEMRNIVRAFVDERDWAQFHSPKNLAMSIAIEAGELMECFQWEPEAGPAREEEVTQAADELADTMIYCLAMANALGINDLAAVILDKLERSGRKYPADTFRGRFR